MILMFVLKLVLLVLLHVYRVNNVNFYICNILILEKYFTQNKQCFNCDISI